MSGPQEGEKKFGRGREDAQKLQGDARDSPKLSQDEI